ncbi:phosphoenolpyruvate--protein phosphotransferase [Chlorobium ferrooxidans]|uniref:Phosphoenolpyruvate-protein phosphotransferase n=1 Tax=Chlorobium ferrooxidans DSM 13031 TaxID=377431 RepID=Q0YSH1_9CHLB|nr:phosphoenolpyruvate--protein phosphotransferase [Chlorobium ferrooxidans]EAT59228.1 Phosphoenolpyruvate-protein phosphotransferase [Chlorobium ferrooxidans DSM 13031]
MSDNTHSPDSGKTDGAPEPAIKNSDTTGQERELSYAGIGASKGIAIGTCYSFVKETDHHEIQELKHGDINDEIERFLAALNRSEKELKKIERVTTRKLGKGYSNLFQAQIMILHDPVLIDTISSRILSERKPAHMVIEEEFNLYLEKFKTSEEQIFRERADDLLDIKDRIIRNLHVRKLHSWIPEGVIVASYHLSPADVILLSRSNVKGFLTDSGGTTSHISLICKSLNIPMVVGLGNLSHKVTTGMPVILDGTTGVVITNPGQERIDWYERKKEEEKEHEESASLTATLPATTKCGVRITFFANIDFKEELQNLTASGGEGVGLFRSENLFTDGTKVPKESEQYSYYIDMAETIAPMPLDIRLFDIGGDKLIYSPVREPNPNLGWRGIRILIDMPEILDDQIRAVIRANVHGNIDILIPMIISLEEIHHVRKVIDRHIEELSREMEQQIDRPGIGAMIEVPAAVEIIDEITRHVDFISIGTNDLTQYTLAVDRNNVVVQDLFEKFHPAIIRQLHRVIASANRNHCRAMICGDMGSDPLALPFLIGCGLRRFSVVASDIPNLKSLVSHYTIAETEELAGECLTLNSTQAIKARLETFQAAH